MLLSSWLNAAVSRLRGARKQTVARSRHGVVRGTSPSAALATQPLLIGVEELEDRALLAVITVNTISDVLDGDANKIGRAHV